LAARKVPPLEVIERQVICHQDNAQNDGQLDEDIYPDLKTLDPDDLLLG
jgi:hypothetical protein